MKKFILLSLAMILTGCGNMSVEPADPFDDDTEPDLPMNSEVYVDPSGLNCSVLNPCNIQIELTPSDGRQPLILGAITTSIAAGIIQTQVPAGYYNLNVTGLPDNYHPVYPNGNTISNEPGRTVVLQVSFESGVEYQQ